MVKRLCLIWLLLILAYGCGQDSAELGEITPNQSVAQYVASGNGFHFPLASMNRWDNGNYAACGTDFYGTGKCHLGNDVVVPVSTSVYAVAAGTVFTPSNGQGVTCPADGSPCYCSSGWGYDYRDAVANPAGTNTCNMALAIQHYDSNGVPFVVVYGHLRYSTAFGVGSKVSPGQEIGKVGRYRYVNGTRISSDHLHFGVYPGTSVPSRWGISTCSTPCSQAGSTVLPTGVSNYGSVAPGTFINATGRRWVAPPSAPLYLSPNNISLLGSTVTLRWQNSSGTFRTHIMVCENTALTIGCLNPDGNMVGIEPASFATNYTLSLPKKATYYWAVRGTAYTDSGGWGPYSTVARFSGG